MSTVDNSHNAGFWYRVAMVRVHMLLRTRPQFHFAVEVLYHSAIQGAVLALSVALLNLIGMDLTINVDLLAHFVGPLGAGALAAGHTRALFSEPTPARGWVVSAVFGAVTVLAFMLLISLRGGMFEWVALSLAPLVGAALFMLLHWLFELEARKSRAA